LWRRQEFSFRDRGSEAEVPNESGGAAPVGDLRDEVPLKLKQFADIVYVF